MKYTSKEKRVHFYTIIMTSLTDDAMWLLSNDVLNLRNRYNNVILIS